MRRTFDRFLLIALARTIGELKKNMHFAGYLEYIRADISLTLAEKIHEVRPDYRLAIRPRWSADQILTLIVDVDRTNGRLDLMQKRDAEKLPKGA